MRRYTLRELAVAVSDLVLPRFCVVCRRRILLDERHICLSCLCDLPLTRFWTCTHNSMAEKYNSQIRGHVTDGIHEPFGHAAALFFYNDTSPYRHIPLTLKYGSGVRMGRYFAHVMGEYLLGSEDFSTVDLVVPVPVHWRRKLSRGYNQAEVIAEEIATVLGVPCRTDVLRRKGYSRSQTRMSITQKATNVVNAFSLVTVPRGVSHVLLVDDTFTSGSTLGECHKVLRNVLPVKVRISVATLAYVS